MLEENPDSLVHNFLKLQVEKPTRGDWASSCVSDLRELKINISLEKIEVFIKGGA